MTASIYDEGYAAYTKRIDPRKCPYTNSAGRQAWMAGWQAAKFDDDGLYYESSKATPAGSSHGGRRPSR